MGNVCYTLHCGTVSTAITWDRKGFDGGFEPC